MKDIREAVEIELIVHNDGSAHVNVDAVCELRIKKVKIAIVEAPLLERAAVYEDRKQ